MNSAQAIAQHSARDESSFCRLSFLFICGLKCQVRVIQKPKQRSKMVNNTLLTLRVEIVRVPLSVHE